MSRVDALKQKAFEEKSFDGFLIANEYNLLYFTGCPGLACSLIPKRGQDTSYVYNTNCEQAKAETKDFEVKLMKRDQSLMAEVAKQVEASRIKKLAFDALSYESYRSLAKQLRGKTKLKLQNSLVWELRKVKDEKELGLMRRAGELTGEGMKAAYETIRPGITEIEAAAEIEYAMRKRGSWDTAFDTIVASGARSAFPHGGCCDKEIRRGDLVVVDIGASYQHYCSDMTRTLAAGKPSEKQKKLYEIVKNAQEKAFQTIKPKKRAREIDAAARKVIVDAGYGEYFVHGLGHGVGLEIHEPPTLGPESRDKLEIGNVVTNEPGIYLVGFGGIRIEDTVVVQKGEAKKLTKGPYSLENE